MVKINLKNVLSTYEIEWLSKNVGPRKHYLTGSIAGEGWKSEKEWLPNMVNYKWTLEFDNESYASFFLLKFPQN